MPNAVVCLVCNSFTVLHGLLHPSVGCVFSIMFAESSDLVVSVQRRYILQEAEVP